MNPPKATILLAVRHGETQWNLCGKQQGHLDSPLTALGVKQAEAMAEGLAKRNIEILYSSDLGRALRTAETIGERLSLGVKTDSRLRERNLGLMQGLTKAEFAARFAEEAAKFNSGNPDYVLPGGESARQGYNRCIECVEDLAAQHCGQRLLIVAHGGTLDSLFRKALNLPLTEPRRFSLFNASINAFSITKGEWRLDSWGLVHHLGVVRTLDDN
jgi:probable phosphoglycerate mutase